MLLRIFQFDGSLQRYYVCSLGRLLGNICQKFQIFSDELTLPTSGGEVWAKCFGYKKYKKYMPCQNPNFHGQSAGLDPFRIGCLSGCTSRDAFGNFPPFLLVSCGSLRVLNFGEIGI